jgi:selenocysteine-specific elongation factor
VSIRNLILATAGHVDHGKTALIKALTGIDTDRLPEEKKRGITIDLGFAHLALPGFSLGVIDVPGHEDFVRNMIAGVGSIDLALLVVAADDGWMPQAEEHLQILEYLAVRHGVVAITKCDKFDGEKVAADARERLRGSSLGQAPIVFTSARDSLGTEQLRTALIEECRRIPEARDLAKPRLFVDRAFTIRGSGTVVTGTLTGGKLARGTSVLLQPQNLRARIRGLQSHNQPEEIAEPATRVALNLAEVRVEEIPRGTIVTAESLAKTSRAIDLLVRRSARLAATTPPLKSGAIVQVHYGSSRRAARIDLLDRSELLPGEGAIARLRFATPVFCFVGDRLILRDSSLRLTTAGGLILDPDAAGKKFRSVAQGEFLRRRAEAPDDLANLVCTQLRRDQTAPRAGLLLKSNFNREEIDAALAELVRQNTIFRGREFVADARWWQLLLVRAAEAIDAAHETAPQVSGLELTQLRAHLRIRAAGLFDELVAGLCENGSAREGNAIRRRDHRPSLPAQLRGAAEKIRAALAARPLDPPARKELMTDAASREAFRFLSANGEIVALNDDVALSSAAFAKMRTEVAQILGRRGGATASELRQSLGTTRRVLIPLLEYFDRIGLTKREGDRRVLRERAAAAK